MGGRGARYLYDAARAAERAPVEVALALLTAIAWSAAIEADGGVMQAWFEIAITAGIAFTAAWAATLLHALELCSARTRWTLTAAGAAVAALYGAFVIDLDVAAEAWRVGAFAAAAIAWLAAVPALGRNSDADLRERRFRQVNARVFLRLTGAVLYAYALFAGLALALRAVDALFELDLDSRIYAHVFGWITFALIPWIVIGGVRDFVRPLEQADDVARVAHRIAGFLVPPLLALYYLILYAYAARILITGEFPKNLVSPMVIAAGVLAALALLLFPPRSAGDDLAGRLLRAAPPLFLPLAALGIVALWPRIAQYGWTEFRVLRLLVLVVLGALAAAASVLLLRKRLLPLRLAPLTLAAALTLAAVGPWSATAIARRSQLGRLELALQEASDARARQADALPSSDSAETRRTDLTPELYQNINDIARYLSTHFGPDVLAPLLQPAVRQHLPYGDIAAQLDYRTTRAATPERPGFGSLRAGVDIPVAGGNRALRILYTADRELRPIPAPATPGTAVPRTTAPGTAPEQVPSIRMGVVSVRQLGDMLLLELRGDTLQADLTSVLAALDARPDVGDLPPDRATITVTRPDGTTAGTLLILEIHYGMRPDSTRIHRLDAILFYETGTGAGT